MSTDTLERPIEIIETDEDTKPDDPGDGDGLAHLFYHDQIEANFLTGADMTAVCGFVKRGPQKSALGLPVCEKCRYIHDNVMKPGDPDGRDPFGGE